MSRPKLTSVFALLLAAGCGGGAGGGIGAAGPKGDTGATGSQGPAGPPGMAGSAAAAGFVYKDAAGTTVSANSAVYFDAGGRVWFLEAETAHVLLPLHQIANVYYPASDCSGLAHVVPLLPRFPFRVSGEAAYRVRPDTLAAAAFPFASLRVSGGSCVVSAGTIQGIPLDATTVPSSAVSEPVLSFVAPLHPEKL